MKGSRRNCPEKQSIKNSKSCQELVDKKRRGPEFRAAFVGQKPLIEWQAPEDLHHRAARSELADHQHIAVPGVAGLRVGSNDVGFERRRFPQDREGDVWFETSVAVGVAVLFPHFLLLWGHRPAHLHVGLAHRRAHLHDPVVQKAQIEGGLSLPEQPTFTAFDGPEVAINRRLHPLGDQPAQRCVDLTDRVVGHVKVEMAEVRDGWIDLSVLFEHQRRIFGVGFAGTRELFGQSGRGGVEQVGDGDFHKSSERAS